MKLSTDYENLLKHVVDGFNRNFFRNEIKEQLKLIARAQKILDTVDPSDEEKFNDMREHYQYQINNAEKSLEAIGKGLMEDLTRQLEDAKKQLIAIQSKTSTKEEN